MSKEIDLFEEYAEDTYWNRQVVGTGIEASLAVLYSRIIVSMEALDQDTQYLASHNAGIREYLESTARLAAVITNRMNPTFVAEFWQRKVNEIAASLANDED